MSALGMAGEWGAWAPLAGNHLWQSSLFVVLAAALCLLMRKNQARVRYALWMAASLKFLFPLSFLMFAGSQIGGLRPPRQTENALAIAVRQVGEPFAAVSAMASSADSAAGRWDLAKAWPTVLVVLWLCGLGAIVSMWLARWWKVARAVRKAMPVRQGREVQMLRGLEERLGETKRIEVRYSKTFLEPGIFGLLRPILVWPEGISERLSDEQLEAILKHELWHVRRRDNLAAAAHMLVEALFWLHPFVWWIGFRLIEERERACDERVLENGGNRQAYAESILKICEFCVRSPLSCIAGVTGADLKRRLDRIMSEVPIKRLDAGRKLLLAACGLLALGAPLAAGLLRSEKVRPETWVQGPIQHNELRYEAVTIKTTAKEEKMRRFQFGPGSFTATNMTLQELIAAAYGLQESQVLGLPGWASSDEYDIQAKMNESTLAKLQSLGQEPEKIERKRMLQRLLQDHFALTLQQGRKDLPVYLLQIADGGLKVREAKPGDTYADGMKEPDGSPYGPHTMRIAIGKFCVQALPMKEVAQLLTEQLDHTVLDQTGLTGDYDFTLTWTPNETQPPPLRGPENAAGPSIFEAIREQLGLVLNLRNVPMDVLAVEHAEKPASGLRAEGKHRSEDRPLHKQETAKEGFLAALGMTELGDGVGRRLKKCDSGQESGG